MHTYASSRVKIESVYRKSELQMFLLISGGHIGAPKLYTNMVPPYKAFCVKRFGKLLRNCGLQRPETWTNCLIDILVFYNTTFSWLLPHDSFQCIFLLRDSENDLYFRLGRIQTYRISFGL